MKRILLALACSLLLVGLCGLASHASDSADSLAEELAEATEKLTQQKYRLRYKYATGEQLRYAVEHLATVDTTIAGNNQKTQLRTKSIRLLSVQAVSDTGEMQFAHTVESVDMWSEVAGREPVRYNSARDETPPEEYAHVSENIGKPISVITIDPQGRIVNREDKVVHPNLSLGGISIPLPDAEIPIGYRWAQPYDVKVRLDDNRIKTVKTRQLYELKKVEAGVATIRMKTQVLTPINNPRLKSQLVQRVSQGEIRFDLDTGRLISRQLDWDATVLGFNGPDSNMKYLARFTEQLIRTPRTAQK